MIEKLTKEQEALLPVYRDKWLKIGLDTGRIDRKQAIKDFMEFDKLVLGYYKNKKPLFIFMPSPLSAWMAVCMFSDGEQIRLQIWSQVWSRVRSQVKPQIWSRVWLQVRSQVGEQIWEQVWSQVWEQVKEQVRSQVKSQVEKQVWSKVRSQVEKQVRSQVESQVWEQVKEQVEAFIYPYLTGSFFVSYFSFYDYILNALNVKIDCMDRYLAYRRLTNYNLIYPLKEVVVFCEKPIEINMRNGLLHADGKPAIKYEDGFSVWALNGIRVPKEIAETPAEKLDPNLALKEKNADVQREIIRKVGYERVMKVAGAKTLDEWVSPKTGLKYTLKQMTIGESVNRKFLCYEHASMKGIYYAKPVPPEVNTCWQARCWQLSLAERDNLKGLTEEVAIEMLPEEVR